MEATKLSLREIDALAAEKVMGWTHIGDVWTFPDECGPSISTACYGKRPLLKPAPDRGEKLDKCGVPAGRDPTPASVNEGMVNGASVFSMSVVPAFTSDIAAAWTLVERLNASGNLIGMLWDRLGFRVDVWQPGTGPGCNVAAATAPLAITLAALKAHGIDVEPT